MLEKLLAKRAQLWERYKEVLERAKSDGLEAESRAELDKLDGEIRELTTDIERLQRADELNDRLSQVRRDPHLIGGDPDDPDAARTGEDATTRYHEAFTSFLRRGLGGLSQEQRQMVQASFDPALADELRAQGVATGAAGGYLVPTEFRNVITEAMKDFSGVRAVANVVETESGAPLQWPTNDDTANKGALLAENTQVTEQDLTLAQKALGAYMYTSKLVRVSIQLLQDAAIDMDNFLGRKLGERLGRIHNEHFTIGTGSAQPQGVVTGATIGVTGAGGQTTTFTTDDLITLIHSVDPAYRNERSRFMLHDLTLASGRKLKDSQGQYLWQPSVQAGIADTLLGYPLTVNNDMPVQAANAKSVLFGDFQAGYTIRDVQGIQMLRLEERYADFLQVGFLAFQRSDGVLDDANAIKAYRNAAA